MTQSNTDTGGTKKDQDKALLALVPPRALLEVAQVMTYGAQKYDAYNWAKGLKFTRLLSASMRHILAFVAGEDLDPETGISHLAHACCSLLMILEYKHLNQWPACDDRLSYTEGK